MSEEFLYLSMVNIIFPYVTVKDINYTLFKIKF